MAEKKIVLVTGANTGLGYEIIKALVSSDVAYEILLGGRSLAKAEQATKKLLDEFRSTKSQVTPIQIDIEDDESIERAFRDVKTKYGKLDALVNNAGAQFDTLVAEGKLTERQGWNQSWNVNVTGTYLMTTTFVPLLLESNDPRLLFIASGTSTLAQTDNIKLPMNKSPEKGWPKPAVAITANPFAYRCSKTGLNMMMRQWYRILFNDGVKVWAVSPGFLATGLTRSDEVNKKFGALDPAIGGALVKDVLQGKRDEDVGKVIVRDSVQPW